MKIRLKHHANLFEHRSWSISSKRVLILSYHGAQVYCLVNICVIFVLIIWIMCGHIYFREWTHWYECLTVASSNALCIQFYCWRTIDIMHIHCKNLCMCMHCAGIGYISTVGAFDTQCQLSTGVFWTFYVLLWFVSRHCLFPEEAKPTREICFVEVNHIFAITRIPIK